MDMLHCHCIARTSRPELCHAPLDGTASPLVRPLHIPCLQVERPEQLQEIVPAKRLSDKVSGILQRIETELDAVDEKIGERMHILDLDNDGLVST